MVQLDVEYLKVVVTGVLIILDVILFVFCVGVTGVEVTSFWILAGELGVMFWLCLCLEF